MNANENRLTAEGTSSASDCTYYIYAEYHFFPGTLYAYRDGPLRDTYTGERVEFSSRQDAEAYLTAEDDGYGNGLACEHHTDGYYRPTGTYVLAHGQLDRPRYGIRKGRPNRRLARS